MNRLVAFSVATSLLLIASIAMTSLAMLVGPNIAFQHLKEAMAQETPQATMIAVGDVMLSRMVQRGIRSNADPLYPFSRIKEYLSSADFVFGNLETTIFPGDLTPTTTMQFRSDPGVEKRLYDVGFRALSIANNHMHDYKKQGIRSTVMALEAADIRAAGAGDTEEHAYAPQYMTTNGITFAFLAYADPKIIAPASRARGDDAGIAIMDVAKMQAAVKAANEKADIVIVSMHSGIEYTSVPTDSQKTFAHAAIDAGADMVVGAHPHTVQPVEIYHNKYVFYSLGNFVFDQMWSNGTRQGLTAKITFTPDGVKNVEQIPVSIDTSYQPFIPNQQ